MNGRWISSEVFRRILTNSPSDCYACKNEGYFMNSSIPFIFYWLRLFIFLLAVYSGLANALQVNEKFLVFNPISSAEYIVDPSNVLTLEDIQTTNIHKQFKPIDTVGDQINFGFSSATYWIRLRLSRSADVGSAWILEIPYTGLDAIHFYAPDQSAIQTGSQLPIQSRPVFNRFYAFPITLNETPRFFYLQVRSAATISVPLKLMTAEQYAISIQEDTIFQFLYFGGIVTLCIFNLFIFIYLRDRIYLHYFLFAGFLGLGIFSGNGYGRLYLWPNSPDWDAISQAVFISSAAASAWLFTNDFLNTRKYLPNVGLCLRLTAILLYAYAALLVIATALPLSEMIFLEVLPALSIPGCILTIYAAYTVSKKGDQSARIFLIAWGILCIGGIVASLRMFDIVPSNVYTAYAVQISSAFEMLFLAFALASRIKNERVLRERAQNDALKSQEALLETFRASEERLEKLVAVRTNKLRDLLANEKKLRSQYVRFGSMISHEFRNPLGIIETQLALLERDLDLDKLPKRVSTIGSATQRLAMLFDRWLQGDRWDNNMDKIFPRAFGLNGWLLDLIEKCRTYHSSHQFHFAADSSKPIIRADEKMLQVAVLNLIDNACKYSSAGSEILISIQHDHNMIGIRIADQGRGIDSADRQIIYEEYRQINPGQQTRGLGLGLSFVKRIVQMHSGRIDLVSELGKGASFTIWFPA